MVFIFKVLQIITFKDKKLTGDVQVLSNELFPLVNSDKAKTNTKKL